MLLKRALLVVLFAAAVWAVTHAGVPGGVPKAKPPQAPPCKCEPKACVKGNTLCGCEEPTRLNPHPKACGCDNCFRWCFPIPAGAKAEKDGAVRGCPCAEACECVPFKRGEDWSKAKNCGYYTCPVNGGSRK